jgi:hypothetical protein
MESRSVEVGGATASRNARRSWLAIRRASLSWGPPVAGVEVCIVNPDSHQRLPTGATGMLLVRGPSIFKGYWNYNGPEPFTEVGGKRWYVTGDLVRLDEDGYIYFCGRLKRFLKIGGEMVSLPALEVPLSRLYPPTEIRNWLSCSAEPRRFGGSEGEADAEILCDLRECPPSSGARRSHRPRTPTRRGVAISEHAVQCADAIESKDGLVPMGIVACPAIIAVRRSDSRSRH